MTSVAMGAVIAHSRETQHGLVRLEKSAKEVSLALELQDWRYLLILV